MGPSHLTFAAVSTAYLYRGNIVAMNQEKGDHSGRKELRLRLSGRKQGRQERNDGELIPRDSQCLMPAPAEQQRGQRRRSEDRQRRKGTVWCLGEMP